MTNKGDNGFLPEDYTPPASNENYMKFQDGENRFRILSKPIIGWEDWKDKKPLRFRMNEKPLKPIDPAKPIKHFWAVVVWNVNYTKIQLLEITQGGIQKAIRDLSKDSDWGNPFNYDIKVTKKGAALDTEYSVNPCPAKSVPDEVIEAFKAKPCNLEALFNGEDPFQTSEGVELNDMPF